MRQVRQTYKYRMYPTPAQARLLGVTLDVCRELYNAALQERRDAYRMAGKSLTFAHQSAELPECKRERPDLDGVYSQVLQDVLHRVDKAFKAFFRRVRAGAKPGYPRFQGRERYDSFTYPQRGWSLDNDRLTLSKMGALKIKLHRPMCGRIKTVSIKREGVQWYVCFSCEVAAVALPPSERATGVDLGLLHFATLADGRTLENPRHLRHSLQKLKRAQQQLARGKRGSHRRGRAKQAVARLHRKVRHQRGDFLHKQSRRLVNEYGTIVFEKLQPANMLKNHRLALSISDAGWGQFVQFCSYKAESAGRTVLFVDPRYTSQTCSTCGAIQRKDLSERWHSCPCGCELDRDHNAARNILRLGWSQRTFGCVEAAGL